MGVGQRVAEDGLHLGAGQCHGSAGDKGRKHAGKTEVQENGPLRQVEAVSGQEVQPGQQKHQHQR